MTNEQTYEVPEVVEEYADQAHLQKPEQKVLALLESRLSQMDMLDIGVGGGRTTVHFAPRVRRYVGIDYADAMVRACRRRFSDAPSHISFMTADARDLSRFASASFDFVLFSFNGLDYISHEDRLKALSEIRRVGKPGGLFCFSSHNMQSLPRMFRLGNCISSSPRRTLNDFVHWAKLRRANPGVVRSGALMRPFGIFNDGAHDFKLTTYYIRPAEQIRQLGALFTDVKVFSRSTGEQIEGESAIDQLVDTWVYYLCTLR